MSDVSHFPPPDMAPPEQQVMRARKRAHTYVQSCRERVDSKRQELGDAEADLTRAEVLAKQWDGLFAKLDAAGG